jgi:hypothetical protein
MMAVCEPVSGDPGDTALRLYESRLRANVEQPENLGKILVVDVDTGEYEIDAEGIRASQRLRDRCPGLDPHRLFAIRIGFDAVYAVGGTINPTHR